MASENVKIIIKELNETTPRGAGTSTDIAYIPGFAKDVIGYDDDNNMIESTKNVPVLCSTVAEFEMHFGTEPYKFVAADIPKSAEYSNGLIEGDKDLSYIYAKELLTNGLSVYYENVCKEMTDTEYTAKIDKLSSEITVLSTFGDTVTAKQGTYASALTAEENAKKALSEAKKALKADPENEAKQKAVPEAQANYDAAVETTKTAHDELYALCGTVDDAEILEKVASAEQEAALLEEEKEQLNKEKSLGKIDYLYSQLPDRFDVLRDKDEYTVKYITSGGYPSFVDLDEPTNNSLVTTMISVAHDRGDAIAIIDHLNDVDRPLDAFNSKSIYSAVNKFNFGNAGTNAAMFTPWAKYTCATLTDDTKTDENEAVQVLPASFGYLMCLASAIKNSPNWLAMAGVTRGMVPNIQELAPKKLLSNVIAEDYQPKFGSNVNNKISINAITNVKPYGLTLWGNRTLEKVPPKGTTATNFLNTRNMISDIKKLAHQTAKQLMFEQDSDKLWNRFKSQISVLLEQLKTGYGISDYKILRGTTKIDGSALTRGELAAVIRIYPLYAIEYFEITVAISDAE